MKPLDYDLKITTTVKAFREIRGIKQFEMAKILGCSESYYSKYEHGCKAFTAGQLKLIGQVLRISHLQIMAIADAYENDSLRITPLSEIIVKYIRMFEGRIKSVWLTENELDILLNETHINKL